MTDGKIIEVGLETTTSSSGGDALTGDQRGEIAARPQRALQWAVSTFGSIAADPHERAMRFLEEAVELAHAEGVTAETASKIAARVYSRPAGHTAQEVGQAAMTLECLAANLGISAEAECANEFLRVQSIPKAEWDRRHAAKVALGIANNSSARITSGAAAEQKEDAND